MNPIPIKVPTEFDYATAAENDIEVVSRVMPIPQRRKALRVHLCVADQALVKDAAKTMSGEALISKLLEPKP